MNKAILILATLLVSALAQGQCRFGSISYKSAVETVTKNAVLVPGVVKSGADLGLLSLSTMPMQFLSEHAREHMAKLTVLATSSKVRDGSGPALDVLEYTLKSKASCNGYDIVDIKRAQSSTFPIADKEATALAQTALVEVTQKMDFVPANRHSGSNSLKAFVPKNCADGLTASISIQRSHQDTTGIMQKEYSFLILKSTREILETHIQSGKFITNMCRRLN